MGYYALLVVSVLAALLAAIFSMSTGMWGCGAVCFQFMAVFWFFVILAVFATWKIRVRRRSEHAKSTSSS